METIILQGSKGVLDIKLMNAASSNWVIFHGSEIIMEYCIGQYNSYTTVCCGRNENQLNIKLNAIQNKLNKGSIEPDDLITQVHDFMQLFVDGKYILSLTDKTTKTFNDLTEKNDFDLVPLPPNSWQDGVRVYTPNHIYPDFLSGKFGYHGADNGYWNETVSRRHLTPERIEYYKGKIRSGIRPIVVLFGVTGFERFTDFGKDLFVIDGHHKLCAYQQLGYQPKVLTIQRDLTDALIEHISPTPKQTESFHQFILDGHSFKAGNLYFDYLNTLIQIQKEKG